MEPARTRRRILPRFLSDASARVPVRRAPAPDADRERTGRRLLLGRGAVLAHRLANRPAAGSDESEQRPACDADRSAAAPLNKRGVSADLDLTPAWDERQASATRSGASSGRRGSGQRASRDACSSSIVVRRSPQRGAIALRRMQFRGGLRRRRCAHPADEQRSPARRRRLASSPADQLGPRVGRRGREGREPPGPRRRLCYLNWKLAVWVVLSESVRVIVRHWPA
jgi:hypothetical protein